MIGFLDSGVGGLSVCAKFYKQHSNNYVFLCDNKNAPYGNKSKKKLLEITTQNINFLIDNYKIETLIIACNTIANTIKEELLQKFNLPIFFVCLDTLKITSKNCVLFATKNTCKKNKNKNVKNVHIKNLPYIIDCNLKNLNAVCAVLKKHKKKFRKNKTIILGCTHFSLIKKQIQKVIEINNFYEYENLFVLNTIKKLKEKKEKSITIVLTKHNINQYVALKQMYYKLIKQK